MILVNDRVEAFSCGELLNKDTAVIHLEKADPELRGLYAVINQQFCQQAWAGVDFVNREQDLGEPGLRTGQDVLPPPPPGGEVPHPPGVVYGEPNPLMA